MADDAKIRVRISNVLPVHDGDVETFSWVAYDLDDNGKMHSAKGGFKDRAKAAAAARKEFGDGVEVIGG